jgi:excisionase family DNA binding protein
VFSDLLLLSALACQAPVSLLSVPQLEGTWSTLSYGLDSRDGLSDGQIFDLFAASSEPLEISDMVTRLPRSPLVLPPHSMRWAYGVAIRNEDGGVIGVVAIMDRWLRQLTKREQRAMAAVARQLGDHLTHLRRPPASKPVPEPLLRSNRSPEGDAGRRSDQPVPASPGPVPAVSERHQLLRSQEVAEIFDVTERTVINWAAAGKLPCLRTIGGHLRFRREEVLRLLDNS